MNYVVKEQRYTGLDISSDVELMSYVYPEVAPSYFIGRLFFSWPTPLGANTTFTCSIFINSQEILPNFGIEVPAGRNGFVAMTQTDIVLQGDQVSLRLLGNGFSQLVEAQAVLALRTNNDPDLSAFVDDVTKALKGINVHPERTILGPCKRQVKTFTLPIKR